MPGSALSSASDALLRSTCPFFVSDFMAGFVSVFACANTAGVPKAPSAKTMATTNAMRLRVLMSAPPP